LQLISFSGVRNKIKGGFNSSLDFSYFFHLRPDYISGFVEFGNGFGGVVKT